MLVRLYWCHVGVSYLPLFSDLSNSWVSPIRPSFFSIQGLINYLGRTDSKLLKWLRKCHIVDPRLGKTLQFSKHHSLSVGSTLQSYRGGDLRLTENTEFFQMKAPVNLASRKDRSRSPLPSNSPGLYRIVTLVARERKSSPNPQWLYQGTTASGVPSRPVKPVPPVVKILQRLDQQSTGKRLPGVGRYRQNQITSD